jgi:flagellar biosynthesis/type III secretory pathway protein FliH
MARYIDADLPCVSDDRPSRAELARERESENYDEGYSDGKDAGYDEGHSDGRADMHAEVMEAIREMLEEHADDERGYAAADIIGMVHDAVMALAEDADVGQEVAGE